jgi:hypothetical protein
MKHPLQHLLGAPTNVTLIDLTHAVQVAARARSRATALRLSI